MRIERDGKTYELTQQELYAAYREQKKLFDRADMDNRIDCCFDGEEDLFVNHVREDAELLDELCEIYENYDSRRESGDWEYDTVHYAMDVLWRNVQERRRDNA